MDLVAQKQKQQGFHKSYKLAEKLGQGSYGVVYGACPIIGRKVEVVAKIQELTKQSGNRDIDFGEKLSMEAEIMRKVSSERQCVQYIDFFNEGNLAYILMEKCERSLPKALEETSPLTVPMLVDCFRQMLRGLAGIHMEGIIHRDIKPSNFLVNGDIGRDAIVKLCDFGSATMISGEPSSSILLWDVCGTVQFSAPEMLSFRGYSTRADMWSFGVLAYVLLFGQYPYMPRPFTMENMRIAIQEDRPKPSYKMRSGLSDAHVVPSMISFIEALLDRDPSARVSAHRALKMDWLRPSSRSKSGSTKLVHASQTVSLEQVIQSAKRIGALGSDSRGTSTSSIDMKLRNV